MNRGALVCDYAWGRPSLARVQNLGYVGAMRYLSTVDRSKNLTAEEIAAGPPGFGWGLVAENAADDVMGDGASQGAHDAGARFGSACRQMADALGFPTTLPIYRAVDFDIQQGQWAVAAAGLDGFNSETNRPSGLYSGRTFAERMVADGHTTFVWQTLAWSYGISGVADLYQNGVVNQVDGVDMDQKVVERDRFALWVPAAAPVPPTPGPLPPVQTYPGDKMTRVPVQIPTDGNGNGVAPVPNPFANLIGLFQNGGPGPTGRLAGDDESGHTSVSIQGGPPNAQVLVFASFAD